MRIGGLQRFTLVDYPERLACTIFLAGCSFRCPWCHNPDLVIPERVQKIPLIKEDNVFDFLHSRKGEIEGIVLTGGEPTLQPDLKHFIQRIKKIGFLVKLDTNGSNPELLEDLIRERLVDYVAMDVKAPRKKYLLATGFNISSLSKLQKKYWEKNVLEMIDLSINILKKEEVKSEFRTTVVPEILDKKDILEIVRWISPTKRYFLQEYRPEKVIDPEFSPSSISSTYLLEILKSVEPFFEECRLRRA